MPWEVYVQGDQSDLDLIAKVLTSEDPSVRREGDSFVLRSTRFESSDDPNEVHRIGSSILDVLSGTARVLLDSTGQFSVAQIKMFNPDGTRTGYAMQIGRFRVRESIAPSAVPAIPVWMNVAMRNGNVADALERLRDPEAWWVLYNVYEIVRDDAGGDDGIRSKGWASLNALDRFRRTACSPQVLGRQARHGRFDGPPPNPMEFNEAIRFVRGLMRQWMTDKAANLQAPTP